ncbi:MAG: LUD domain-containing protein, partial [Candidatus Bathyarchaeia archaeon]
MKPNRAQQHEALLTDIAQAMSNQNQRAALRLLGDNFRRGREQALNFYPDLDGLRREAKAVRTKTMANLEFYLNQLTSNLRALGAKVHIAPTPESAVEYMLDVAERNGVRLAVKGKSITSEEIDLNAHLEAKGIRVVETDLGELILQMARERPSHIIAPAIHKTKEQIAELFSKELGRHIPAEPERIAEEARLHLRNFFLKADLGITGVNMAIAESGALMLVTNEGNGRLVTSLPRIHIALMGCEKVVPTLKDALMLLRLLIVSAVGQKITSCVSFIRGPNLAAFPSAAPERKELHVVILDNGRLTMSQDPHFNSA